MKMSANSNFNSPDSGSSQKGFLTFQRRKIGSIRDNNKLNKILQQFESAGGSSAPCSVNNQSNFGQLFTLNPSLKENPVKNAMNSNVLRRHSEGEVVEHRTNRYLIQGTLDKCSTLAGKSLINNNGEIKYSNYFDKTTKTIQKKEETNDIALKKYFPKDANAIQNRKDHNGQRPVFNASDFWRRESKSELVDCSSPMPHQYHHTPKITNSFKDFNIFQDVSPPPIPRRGLSLPVTSVMQDHSMQSHNRISPISSSTKLPVSSNNIIKQDSVKNAIQMYEGLSSKSLKSLKTGKKDVSSDYKKVNLSRKSSKRNSFRSHKLGTEAKKHNTSSPKSENKFILFKHSKEDSGIGFSDPEDLKSPQAMYQSLCSIKPTSDQCDTYDRLDRVHDMVNRIHHGQSSTCAACKAIPIGSMQISQAIGPSVLHVKCNVLSPHHHPPCICFSCQHSVFSCSQDIPSPSLDLSVDNLDFLDEGESLYYNVCCLNKPNCEGWRRSRRRPVCEQNGRLCVVNCDMNQNLGEAFYEKIFEWNTKKPILNEVKNSHKQPSGDSCDSDEGWVDITDSEDERIFMPIGPETVFSENQRSESAVSTVESPSIPTHDMQKLEALYSKLGLESISRAESSEHLYETIGDIELLKDNPDPEVQNKTVDNEPDSGEWSTESSSSPTPTEQPFIHTKVENKSSVPSSRFSIASDFGNQNSVSKKTFIKNVLGKKSTVPKKRRMSHFFVPWLAANHEYSSRSPKTVIKKQSRKVDGSCRAFSKMQRSQSIPLCTTGAALSVTKIFSSSEILDCCQSDSRELEQRSSNRSDSSFGLSAESIDLLSQRGSLASSTYINTEQLHSIPMPVRQRSSKPEDCVITDVSVDRVFHRSASGDSVHSYFVFRPIKEEEVPLYQFYERNVKERVALCRSPECMSPVMWSTSLDSGSTSHECQKSVMVKPQLSVVEQLSPDAKDIKMLWCELPEVKESGILVKISAQELKLQEATFEFIQSQASYIRSLKVLYEHFIVIPEFCDPQSSFCVLSKHEYDVLFSDIILVKELSERLMAELTTRWSDDILIPDICDIIHKHTVMPSFSIYVKYCSNRIYQERTLKELKETRLCFLEVLRKLESNPACQGLSLESFLFLPMQHITRLPLLLDNIFRWLRSDSPSYNTCKMALEAVHKVFMECNDSARKMERLEEMFVLNKQLEFKECKVIPLISASRWLLKKGELVKLEFDKKTFGRSSRCSRVPIYLFLFNDLLIVSKRKNEDSYSVLDYCLRDKVQAMAIDAKGLQQPDLVPSSCHYLIYLTLFSNHQGSAVDIIMNCTLQSERTRWIEAIHPVPKESNADVWEHDSPQVQCVRSYVAQQPDELSLQESDVVTIQRKMNDGWYEGRRLRDGLQGWFPASYTMDIPCSRARASNLRQCYRLLMLSQKNETKKS